MRLFAGYFSATLLLLLIGYVVGYAVCLWRYQPSPARYTGTVVMPVLDIPDDFEPPAILPGD